MPLNLSVNSLLLKEYFSESLPSLEGIEKPSSAVVRICDFILPRPHKVMWCVAFRGGQLRTMEYLGPCPISQAHEVLKDVDQVSIRVFVLYFTAKARAIPQAVI